MNSTYYSSVLNYPINEVWSLIRDFNSYPNYIDGVTESVLEYNMQGDEVGAVRRFCYRGEWIRQRLIAHSDADHFFTYAGMDKFNFPANKEDKPPAPIDYEGTLRLKPIIDGDRTFVEWFVKFQGRPTEITEWSNLLMELIPQWVDSLRRALSHH
jgi:hypothetical protein